MGLVGFKRGKEGRFNGRWLGCGGSVLRPWVGVLRHEFLSDMAERERNGETVLKLFEKERERKLHSREKKREVVVGCVRSRFLSELFNFCLIF